jgi:hypothetical protein
MRFRDKNVLSVYDKKNSFTAENSMVELWCYEERGGRGTGVINGRGKHEKQPQQTKRNYSILNMSLI